MAMRPALAEATNDHWSGVVVFPSRGNPFTQCVGSWGVPQATRFENDHVTTYHISCWTGIDGDGTSDVVQAGTHGLVEPDGTTGFYAWFEWYPLNEQQIDPVSFPVEPGDQVEVALAVDAPNTLTYYFTNFTKNNYTQGQIVAPRGVTCAGNCAEWIVERPAINGELSQLAYYNQVYFDTAVATGNDQTIPPADLRDGTEFSMLVDGKIISVGAEISINGVSRPSDSLTCTDKRGVNDGAE
jgi:hypothetical protein